MKMRKVDVRSTITTYRVRLESVTPYSQSRAHSEPKLPKETSDKYEERTWRSRLHTTDDGNVFIPGSSIKNALAESAKYLGKQIPGKGKSTYTKHFEAGIMVMADIVLPLKSDDVLGQNLFVPSDGIRGSGKRVWKTFPLIKEWNGDIDIVVTDETITEDVLLEHLAEAGNIIGIGRFRPRRNGYYGRFRVTAIGKVA